LSPTPRRRRPRSPTSFPSGRRHSSNGKPHLGNGPLDGALRGVTCPWAVGTFLPCMHLSEALSSSTTVTVTVRAFARYAEILGLEETTLELAEPATVGDAIKLLRKSVPSGPLLPERPLVAVNLEHVLVETPLREGDELALLPPLAGG